jgi:hypothetical protein
MRPEDVLPGDWYILKDLVANQVCIPHPLLCASGPRRVEWLLCFSLALRGWDAGSVHHVVM